MAFNKVEIQSGGTLIIESNNDAGITLAGKTMQIHAGALLEVDRVTLSMETLTLDQAGLITANAKVRLV